MSNHFGTLCIKGLSVLWKNLEQVEQSSIGKWGTQKWVKSEAIICRFSSNVIEMWVLEEKKVHFRKQGYKIPF